MDIIDFASFPPHDEPMKFGDELRGVVVSIDEKGRGVFEMALPHDPKEIRSVVVPFAAVGDDIRATFVRRDKGQWIGRLSEVVSPSTDRVATPCPHAGTCGGCLWQHLAYEAQLKLKLGMINQAFASAKHDEQFEMVVPSAETLYYRNRMDYAVGWKGEIGLKEYGSWSRYIDLSTCLLLDKETPQILETVREIMKEHTIVPWDAKKLTGVLRYVVIRLGKNTGERMITLIVKEAAAISSEARQAFVDRLSSFATTLYLGEQPEVTDLSLAKTFDLLHGKPMLTEDVNGLRYQIHPNSFFQTNTAMASVLQKTVLDFLGETKDRTIMDLYCGLGFFGLACAKAGARVYGHELDAPAIDLARQNAIANGVEDRATFGSGPVEDMNWEDHAPDAVIIDPPRAGLHPRALKTLLEKRPPTIVYVSCNYHQLAKELVELKTAYRVERWAALDLFPQTPHMEVVVKLVRY